MKKNNYLFYIIIVIFSVTLIGCTKSIVGGKNENMEDKNKLEGLISLLSDKNRCDDAFIKIMSFGKEAIPFLIENASNKNLYKGTIIYNHASSFLTPQPTVGLVSLYLIEAILTNEIKPSVLVTAPMLVNIKDKFPFNDSKREKDINLKKAQLYYRMWWEKIKEKSIGEIRRTSPLSGTDLMWLH